uniref:mRNA cap 0 methyltransferase domain-containing protein n=1 Tax=viral metagenome TaxID=1070528 RepID=A0A6C0ET86_9ZZZZ
MAKRMDMNKTFSIYSDLLQKKNGKSQDNLEQYDIRNKSTNIEYEVRFGRDIIIDKIKFEEVQKKLMMSGFVVGQEDYYLKINNYVNGVRCEINDLSQIKAFCKSNTLPDTTVFVIKERFKEYPDYYENNDFNFRVSIQKEVTLKDTDKPVVDLMRAWSSDKSYRYMNRVSLIHPSMPGVQVDLSVVKSVKKKDGLLKEKEFSLSKLFDEADEYEIEIELKTEKLKRLTSETFTKLTNDLKKTIKYITSGFQSSNFPITNNEQNNICYEYYGLFTSRKDDIDRFVPNSSMFIGPSSYTLQKINLINDVTNMNPCILKDFCVTDKADGERKMLFIAGNGKMYFINMGLKVQYTGAFCEEPSLYGLLIDGEHILYDKKKKYINLFAAFDIYFMLGKSVRLLPFISEGKSNRYYILKDKMRKINETIKYVSEVEQIKMEYKRFAVSSEDVSIQECCSHLFSSMDSFPYNTDGLIFTSKSLGVGCETDKDKPKNNKYTWKNSFKWKPPAFNTIDFLVKIKKSYGNRDEIKNVTTPFSIEPFKVLHLYIGYDEKTHGFMNPQEMLFHGIAPVPHNDVRGLVPALFMPTSPYDNSAYISYVQLKNDTSGTMNMFTEENEIIETDTIIEFRYEFNDDKNMRWKPLRVRHDKTAEYKNTHKIFGNAYHVANSNWHTIHNPITKEMLTNKELVLTMDDIGDKDVYYNKDSGPSKTVALRDFHNGYVKKRLIETVSPPGGTLIDFAVGKGGDLQKWISSRLKFVLGIDIAKDNIHNKKDGACARYISIKQNKKDIPEALFIRGNTSKLILNDDFALIDDPTEIDDENKSKFVIKQVLAVGPKDVKYGNYIAQNYGVASKLFDVGSIQFAIHYMFENKFTLHNFLKNCSDLIKVGGYFIGTCYDGTKIFKMLEETEIEGDKEIFVGDKKIWSVVKKYDNIEFQDNEDCLGLMIGVFQETINKVFDEYLVNFKYLIKMLQQYGFELNTPNEMEPIADFGHLYKKMMSIGAKYVMSEEESQISFLNNYFIFKKLRTVDTNAVHQFYTKEQEKDLTSISRPVRLNKKIILKK